MFCFVVTVVAIAYIFFDVNYFIRIISLVWFGRVFQKKCGVKDTTTVYGFCTSQDVDILLNHLNNARYVRDMDFARVHFYDRTGIYSRMRSINATMVQGATSIRYRRPIPLFAAYKIETKLLYWEGTKFFMEQKFIILRDGFVAAVALSRQNLIRTDAATIMKNFPDADTSFECPEEVEHWQRSVEVSSAALRKKN